MAELPAMPLYTDAYLGDTGHLTTIEHGAYMLLLMTMWRAGGSLPNDDAKLARFARLTAGQWARIKPTIMEFFRIEEDGSLVQGRLTDELEFVRQKSKSQSAKARAKWRKYKAPTDAAASSGQCQTDAPTPTPTPTPTPSSAKRKRASAPPPFEDFWEKALGVWRDLASAPGNRQEAKTAWDKLSPKERWVAFLVPEFYAASVREERRVNDFPDLKAKNVCRYLSRRLFSVWADQCEDTDEAQEQYAAPDRTDAPVSSERLPGLVPVRGAGDDTGGRPAVAVPELFRPGRGVAAEAPLPFPGRDEASDPHGSSERRRGGGVGSQPFLSLVPPAPRRAAG